jgi:hypothetical protein
VSEFWAEILHIFTDPAHMVAEFAWESVFLGLSLFIMNWRVRREHKRLDDEHGVEHLYDMDDNPIPYVLTDKGRRRYR